ncbi:roquin-2-like [Palaemon carinicauda]|uniref:roquin-2-like n=1 Tax=Palaemon carinicauda TaxID=392227 RepID=UPI0035B681E3
MACASRTVFREDNKTMWLMRCEICTEDFSEEHKPVVLSCSHSFCLTCLTRIIESRDKRCPDCGQNIKGNSSADLTINRNLLDLVKYLKQKKGLHIPPEPEEDVWKMAEVNRHHWKQAEREIREMVLINAKKIKKLQNTNTILAHDLKLKVDPIVMENRKLIQKLHGYNAGMIRDTDLVTEMQAVASIAKERAKRAKNFTESGRM